jgi:FlaG/FlaF family flagellin (archaellin)
MNRRAHTIAVALLVTATVAVAVVGTAAGTAQRPNAQQEGPVNETASPFDIQTGNVVVCGLTCREVEVTLTNQHNETLSNITVESDITTGEQLIAQREAQIESLEPNESVSRTIQARVGLGTLSQIRQNNGRITIETQVASDRYNETFVRQRQVG